MKLTGLLALTIVTVWLNAARAQDLLDRAPQGVFTRLYAYRGSSGRTLVPLRGVGQFCDAEVGYRNKIVTLQKGETIIALRLGERTATITRGSASRTVELEEPARAPDGITLVPLRFVGDSLGATVTYKSGSRAALDLPTPYVELVSGHSRGRLTIQAVPPAQVDALRRAAPADLLPTDRPSLIVVRKRHRNFVFVQNASYVGDEPYDPWNGWHGGVGYLAERTGQGWRYHHWSHMDTQDAAPKDTFLRQAREAGVPREVLNQFFTIPSDDLYGVGSPYLNF